MRGNPHDDVTIPAWEAVLDNQSEVWLEKAAATDKRKGPGKVDHCPIESRCAENDEVNVREGKSAVKELVANEMSSIVKEALNDF